MSDTNPSAEEHKMMFGQLVMTLGTSALQGLGKIVNPITKKTEVNLEGAQAAIDMLDMLEAKTKGNLDNQEQRFLKTTIADLKINYIETQQAATKAPAAEAPAPTPASTTETPQPAAAEPTEEKRRFHKKYE